METSIYDLLEYDCPQGLIKLWDYQKQNYGIGLEKPEEEVVISLEEIDQEMRKPPSRSRD